MYNYLKVLILSILVLLILLIIYMILDVPRTPITLKIEPIQVEAIKISPLNIETENSVEKRHLPILPVDILSKLKTASEQSKEAIVSSQEEQSSDILASLTKKIEEELVEKVAIQTIPIKVKAIKKEIITKKKVIIQKKIAIKKETKSKVKTKAKINKAKKNNTPIKTFITLKKELPPKKTMKKKTTQKKNMQTQKHKKLSREKEVALYNKTYGNTLEVVNVSDNFEIKAEDTLPDSHYFEPIKSLKDIDNNSPLEFVEKLGVVVVSDKYESNFIVPQKVDLAKEGIVNFSSSSINNKELQQLEFVDSLGVIEVSEDFETINAKRYLD